MARPTKLTLKLQQKIVTAIAAGNYMETAAALAGVHKDSIYDWLKKGRKERDRRDRGLPADQKRSVHAEFSDAVEKALAESEVRDVAVISIAAAQGDWRASAWRLERKFPDKYGRRQRVTVSGSDDGPVQLAPVPQYDLSKLTDVADLRALRTLLEKCAVDGD